MKNEKLNLFNTQWKVEYFEQSDIKTKKSVYEPGGLLTFDVDKCGELGDINLKISGLDKFIQLPPFMAITPTLFENEGIQYVAGIIGSDPCELHRLAMWFGGFDINEPWFKFKVDSLYDNCVCPEQDNCFENYIIYSGHGIGGGTGGFVLK